MFDDVESDFWKQKFIELQKNSMNDRNFQRLTLEEAEKEILMFKNKFPECMSNENNSGSSISWEIFLTSNTKLRIFIQNQIKASLMQSNRGEFIKIADAKFINNPFPYITEFYKNKDSYVSEISALKQENYRYKKQQKIAGEIIKALLQKRIREKSPNLNWQLEPLKKDYKLIVGIKPETKEFAITMENYSAEINQLEF